MTPQDRAERSARQMMLQDAASQGIGARIEAVGPDFARMSMRIGPQMINGHGICHGGYIFMLADSAFAFACNSDNVPTVAQSNHITYHSPAYLDEGLTAEARGVARSGRSGTYDVTVRAGDGRVVALFRGLARKVGGHHFAEEAETP